MGGGGGRWFRVGKNLKDENGRWVKAVSKSGGSEKRHRRKRDERKNSCKKENLGPENDLPGNWPRIPSCKRNGIETQKRKGKTGGGQEGSRLQKTGAAVTLKMVERRKRWFERGKEKKKVLTRV